VSQIPWIVYGVFYGMASWRFNSGVAIFYMCTLTTVMRIYHTPKLYRSFPAGSQHEHNNIYQ